MYSCFKALSVPSRKKTSNSVHGEKTSKYDSTLLDHVNFFPRLARWSLLIKKSKPLSREAPLSNVSLLAYWLCHTTLEVLLSLFNAGRNKNKIQNNQNWTGC